MSLASIVVGVNGQITLTPDLLQHLQVGPGDQVLLEKLPGGELRLQVTRPAGSIEDSLHVLDGKMVPEKAL